MISQKMYLNLIRSKGWKPVTDCGRIDWARANYSYIMTFEGHEQFRCKVRSTKYSEFLNRIKEAQDAEA